MVSDSERPSMRLGIRRASPSPHEAAAIRFPLERPVRTSLQAEDVNGPELLRIRPARPSPAEQGAAIGLAFRFDEELAERGVREVRGRRSEDDLGVARHLDFAGTIGVVHDRQPADFDIVLGRDRDIEPRREAVMDAMEGRAFRRQRDQVFPRLDAVRICGWRPDRAGPYIAQIEKLAAGIASGIAAAPGDRSSPAEARAAAPVGDYREVVAVRKKGA